MRISMGERRSFGASASLSIRASSLHFVRSQGSVNFSPPKLVRVIGSSSTRTDKMSPNLCLVRRPPYVRESSCLGIRLPSRRDVAAESEAAVQRDVDCSCSWYFFPCIRYGLSTIHFIEVVIPVVEAPVHLLTFESTF